MRFPIAKRPPTAQDSGGLQRLVFQSLKPTNWNIYYFAALQTAPKQITSGPGTPHLYALDMNQGGDPRLLIDSNCMEDQAAISPDGRTIAFMSDYFGNANIHLMPFDPTITQPPDTATNLTNNASGNFRPAFSPDGKWIAFSSDRGRPVASNPFFPSSGSAKAISMSWIPAGKISNV